MKKICLFFAICLIFVFAGCGGSKNDEKTENTDSEEAVPMKMKIAIQSRRTLLQIRL